jgi:hypothetical protein
MYSATCANIINVRSVGGMTLGTSLSVDYIGNVLNTSEVNVTLALSMVVMVAQTPSKRKLNFQMTSEGDDDSRPWHGIDFGSDIKNEF